MRRWRIPFATLAVAVGSACARVSGLADLEIGDDPTASGVDEDASTDADAPPAVCTAPSRCLGPPPGWEGPFVVANGAACPASFDRAWERLGPGDAAAPPAQCGCSCGAITGSCNVTLLGYGDDFCGTAPLSYPMTPGQCRPLQQTNRSAFRATATANATCPPIPSTTVERLDAGVATVGCSPVAPPRCDQGVCLPASPPPATRVCVRPILGGEPPCPPSFPDKIALAAGLEDTRGCSPCACTAVAPTCTYSINVYGALNCGGGARGPVTAAVCVDENGIDSARLGPVTVAGSCSPSGGSPTGGVTTTVEGALCCER